MKRVNYALASLLLIASGYYGLLFLKKVGVLTPSLQLAEEQGAIAWHKSESEALAKAKATGQPMIVDFTAEWCEACHEIEAQIFQDPKFVEKLGGIVPLRVDVTSATEKNTEILQKYGVISLPTIVFVGADGTILKRPRIHGLIPLEKFLEILEAVLNI